MCWGGGSNSHTQTHTLALYVARSPPLAIPIKSQKSLKFGLEQKFVLWWENEYTRPDNDLQIGGMGVSGQGQKNAL